ncbi:hypothetical protein [Roseateles sp. PN1]|uniref:hypothetical protein n=1 Tax=Roseateles sp. PN1 TaxID=3137372 RepID=UPI00313A1B52
MLKKLELRLAGTLMVKNVHVLAFAASMLLVACGGGGGGGGGSPAPTVSGLLPAAPTLGTTLAEDAGPWRPLRDKSVYTYRGQHSVQGGGQAPSFYANTVTQVAQGSGMREDSTNTFNEGPDATSSPVSLQSGAIRQQIAIDLADGVKPLALDFVELQSPVRTNDRYVVADRRIDDIGIDADGDKKNDGMDLAAWVQVVGEETLDLPNRTGVRTIHTDTTIRARVVLTSGALGPIVEEHLGIWYAAGIGPVKVRRDNPHPSLANVRVIDEETLVTYDGISDGVGFTTPPVKGLFAASGSTPAVGIPYPYGAVAFEANVVTISDLPDTFPAAGFTLTQLDTRGAVVAAKQYTNTVTGGGGTGQTLLRLGNELRMLYIGAGNNLYMLRFSADGQTLLSNAPMLLLPGPFATMTNTGPQFFKAVASGGSLWVLTQTYWDSSSIDQTRIELRQFGADGSNVGTPRLIESGSNATGVSYIALTASDSRLMLLWRKGYEATAATGHLLIDGSTGAAAPAAAADVYASLGPCTDTVAPVLTDTASLVACSVNQAPTVVTLQANGLVLTAAGGSVRSDSLVPTDWITNQASLSWLNNPDSNPKKLSFYGARFGKVFTEDVFETAYQQFAEVPLVNGIPDKTGYRLLARVQGSLVSTSFAFSFGNRILLVGGDCYCQGGRLGTMLVWR